MGPATLLRDGRPAPGGEPAGSGPRALIEEARRRTRRRRLRGLTAAVAALGAALLVYDACFGGGASTALSSTPAPLVDRGAFAHQGVLAFISMGRLWLLDGAGGTLRAVT